MVSQKFFTVATHLGSIREKRLYFLLFSSYFLFSLRCVFSPKCDLISAWDDEIHVVKRMRLRRNTMQIFMMVNSWNWERIYCNTLIVGKNRLEHFHSMCGFIWWVFLCLLVCQSVTSIVEESLYGFFYLFSHEGRGALTRPDFDPHLLCLFQKIIYRFL